MAYNYSNPYQSTSSAPSHVQAPSPQARARQLLFSGLPVNITEADIRELLLAEPLRLSPQTTFVECFYGSDAQSNGIFLVHVASAHDAERVRQEYSGKTIDSTYVLSVCHVLPTDQSLSSAQSSASTIAARIQPTRPPRDPKPKTQPASKSPAIKKQDDKPAGLKLLARLGKPGLPKDKQLALLEKQKANLNRKGAPGAALLSRLQTAPAGHAAKSKPKPQRLSSGTAKVGRAKANTSKDAMDVDKPTPKKNDKPQPKTQAELDEEMRAYERARRFA